MDDHEWFRRRFAELDELAAGSPAEDELVAVWAPLAARLDVHAVAEEEIFYPALLARGDPGEAEDETLDAIGDHNDIRDGVRDAQRHPVGSPGWWDAVATTRLANDHHMAEEERDGLADFRRNVDRATREAMGERFRAFMAEHASPAQAAEVDTGDKDPERYVADAERALGTADGSLGIGSLKGR